MPPLSSFAGTATANKPSLGSFAKPVAQVNHLDGFQTIDTQKPVSMTGLNKEQVVPQFQVNTDNFGFKDIPAGFGATIGNAILAVPHAIEQAAKIPGQVKEVFTKNGGDGIYGKYSEGVDSLMQGTLDTVFKPIISGLKTGGLTAEGAIQALTKSLTGHNFGGKDTAAEQAFNNLGKNTADLVAGAAKFGIEQPTTAALTLQQLGTAGQGKFDASGNPIKPTDLIHEVGGKTIDTIKPIVQPVVDNIVGGASKLANTLEKESMRLTPTQKAKLGTKLNDISQFNIDNAITGSPETRFAKANDVVSKYHDTLDTYLKDVAPDNTIDKQILVDRLNNLKIKYQASDVADLEGAGNQIDSAVKRLDASSTNKVGVGDSIQTVRANNLKSSYYNKSFGNQIGSGLTDEVQGDIARVYKEAIEENLKGAPDINGQTIENFNKDYGTALQSRKILKMAVGKPQIGPIGRLTAKGVGGAIGSIGGPIGEGIGLLYGDKIANLLAGTHARSILSDLLSGGAEPYLPDIINGSPTNTIKTLSKNVIDSTVSGAQDYVKNPKMGLSVENVTKDLSDSIKGHFSEANDIVKEGVSKANNPALLERVRTNIVDSLLNEKSGTGLGKYVDIGKTIKNMSLDGIKSLKDLEKSINDVIRGNQGANVISSKVVVLRKPILTSMANQIDGVINKLENPSGTLNEALAVDPETIKALKFYQQMSEKQWEKLPPEQFTELVNLMKDNGAKVEGFKDKTVQPRTKIGQYDKKK